MTLRNISLLLLVVTSLTASTAANAAGEKILFLRMAGKSFNEVFEVMRKELSKKFTIEDQTITRGTPYEETKKKIVDAAPALIITMDNLPLSQTVRYNSEQSDPKKKIHGVALMGLNLKSVLKGNKEISGVSFESPAYTLFTQFRFLLKKPLKKILAFYRKSLFHDTIDDSTKLLAREGIELHAVDAEADGTGKEAVEQFVDKNLKKEVLSDKYDAVWVVLDSGLITPHLYKESWVPAAREAKIPFVSGTEEFVAIDADFVTFAVTPNLADLGNQAVQQVESQLIDHTAPREIGVEELISVNKILNLDRAHKIGLSLKDEALKDIKTLE